MPYCAIIMNMWLDLFLKEPSLQARGVAKVDSEVEKSANALILLTRPGG